jgi:hypothetical protein
MIRVTATIFGTKHLHFPALLAQLSASATALVAGQSNTYTRKRTYVQFM